MALNKKRPTIDTHERILDPVKFEKYYINPPAISDTFVPIVLELCALGHQYQHISNLLDEKYGVLFDPTEIQWLAVSNRPKIVELRKDIRKYAPVDLQSATKKIDYIIDQRLSRAIRDADRKDALQRKFVKGEVNAEEFRRDMQTIYEPSGAELLKMQETLTAAHKRELAADAAPARTGKKDTEPDDTSTHENDIENTPEYKDALARGDTVALAKLTFPKGDKK